MTTQLFYMNVQGVTLYAQWEMTMYLETDVLTPAATMNAWSAALDSFFRFGPPDSDGYFNIMDANQGTRVINGYLVDPITDHKTKYSSVEFDYGRSGPIGGGAASFSGPLVFLRPAVVHRANIGRLKLPPVGRVISGDELDSSIQPRVANWLHNMFVSLSGDLLTPVVRNRTTHTSYPVAEFWLSNKYTATLTRNDRRAPRYIRTAV